MFSLWGLTRLIKVLANLDGLFSESPKGESASKFIQGVGKIQFLMVLRVHLSLLLSMTRHSPLIEASYQVASSILKSAAVYQIFLMLSISLTCTVATARENSLLLKILHN